MSNLNDAFCGCTSLTGRNDFTGHAFHSHSLISVMSNMFKDCVLLNPVWSKKAFKNMPDLRIVSGLFQNCSRMMQAPINFCANSPNIFYYNDAFNEARSMKNLPLNFDLTSVPQTGATTAGMFQGCHSMEGNAMDVISRLPDWSTSNTSAMFEGCTNLSDYKQIPGRFL